MCLYSSRPIRIRFGFKHVPDGDISCCPLSYKSGCKVVEVQVACVSRKQAVAAVVSRLVLHMARKLAM